MPAEGSRERYVPALGRESLTALYDPVIRLTTRERTFKDLLLDQAGLAAGQRVLDLGCGTGTLAIWAKQREPGIEVTGIDGDPEVLDRARRKAAEAAVAIDFREAMADELPFEAASFDRVVSTLFFHHLGPDTKRRCAAEIARVLKPGGELHVADFGRPSDPLMRMAFLTIQLTDGFENTRENVAGELPRIFEAAGLRDLGERRRLRTVYGSLVLLTGRAAPPRPAG
jgi:ubiquinone/menaquinone biosynthesis C-methylase UbiE